MNFPKLTFYSEVLANFLNLLSVGFYIMKNNQIIALSFDTGGTVLDWHSSFKKAFSDIGARYNLEHDWALMANNL